MTVRLFLIGLLLAMAWRPADVLARKGARRTRLTGLGADNLAAESVTIDIAGNTTVADTHIDPSAHTETRTIDYPDSDIDAQSVSANGFLVSSTSKTGITVSYAYDALGRRTGVTDPRTAQASPTMMQRAV